MGEAEASREAKCSDNWPREQRREQLCEKRLTAYEKGADRRVYVLRSDLEKLMSPGRAMPSRLGCRSSWLSDGPRDAAIECPRVYAPAISA